VNTDDNLVMVIHPDVLETSTSVSDKWRQVRPECEIFNGSTPGLSMHEISVYKCVFEKWCDGVYIVYDHVNNVLKHEAECLEYPILYVEFRCAILVYDSQ